MEELRSQREPGVTAASVPVSLEACVKGGMAQLSPGTLKSCGKFSFHVPDSATTTAGGGRNPFLPLLPILAFVSVGTIPKDQC